MVYVKLIAVLVQHWILLTATWCECRRSLMKAAAIIADWVTLLIDALDDLDRLIAILSRMKDVLLKAGARVQNRNIHPSLSQLYRILYFWTTCLKFGVWECDFGPPHRGAR